MARLGIPDSSGFWVGGNAGRYMAGERGYIARRIEQTIGSARAVQQELDELLVLLGSEGAPRGGGIDALREGIVAARAAMDTLGEHAGAALADALAEAAPTGAP